MDTGHQLENHQSVETILKFLSSKLRSRQHKEQNSLSSLSTKLDLSAVLACLEKRKQDLAQLVLKLENIPTLKTVSFSP